MALYMCDKKTSPSSRYLAHAECYTTMVPSDTWTNDRLGTDTPRGVLGGMVATLSGCVDYTVRIATDHTSADYLFLNDAAGAAFENSPSVASGKIALLPIGGAGDTLEVDVYETHNESNVSIMATYTINHALYVSSRGLITNTQEQGGSGRIVGVVTKIPTTASPRLGLKIQQGQA
jgi:hypothetical protein